MASNLAPVYLDDARVTLQGDPRPQVSKILQAGGYPAGQEVVIVRLREDAGADGHPLGLEEVIDREKATTPVYLRILKGVRRDASGPAGGPVKAAKSVPAPGDILRGTDAVSPTHSGEATARKGAPQGFAESQSFADPVHRGGSPRVAQGSRPSGVPTTTTTSRGALERASEEE